METVRVRSDMLHVKSFYNASDAEINTWLGGAKNIVVKILGYSDGREVVKIFYRSRCQKCN